jgi:glycosyltransferase involved in cell wall biosynthesis
MKALWVTNTLIGDIYEHINKKPSNGVWMDALLKEFKEKNEHDLVVVTTGDVTESISIKKDNVTYYLIPGGYPISYKDSKKNVATWKKIIEDEKPDILMLWGNEFQHSLSALKAADGIPSAVFMQGVLDAIARYYYAGIDEKIYRKNLTLRDIIKRDSVINQKKKYQKRAKYEKEIFDISGNILSENTWCNTHIKAISKNVKSYYCPLSINSLFLDYNWSLDDMTPHTICCNASGYPLKGLHILIKAVGLLKEKYPDVKLLVPGKNMFMQTGFSGLIHNDGYMKYITKLIKELNVEDNISFIGFLPQNELAKIISKSNCFVVPSALENHSSSLKEAMMTGTPVLSSIVGGVPEYVTSFENGILYRFEEYELLAEYISMIFDNKDLAQKLSENGKNSMANLHSNEDIYNKVIEAYKDILNRKNNK